MTIILGLAAAIFWGAADFLARYSTRIIGTYRTLFFLQFFGLVGLSIYLAVSGEFGHLLQSIFWQAWAWALLAAFLTPPDNPGDGLPSPGPRWSEREERRPRSEGIQPAQDDVTERSPETQ